MMKAKALVPKHNRIRRSRGDIVFDIINVIIVVLITLTMIYPMWYVIIVSFATPEEAVMGRLYIWPKTFTLEAYEKVKKIYEDYAEERLHFCNWQEPYFEGNWGMSQRFVDRFAFLTMKKAKRGNFSKKNRFYIAKENEGIVVFLLTRDVFNCDYVFVFEKKR